MTQTDLSGVSPVAFKMHTLITELDSVIFRLENDFNETGFLTKLAEGAFKDFRYKLSDLPFRLRDAGLSCDPFVGRSKEIISKVFELVQSYKSQKTTGTIHGLEAAFKQIILSDSRASYQPLLRRLAIYTILQAQDPDDIAGAFIYLLAYHSYLPVECAMAGTCIELLNKDWRPSEEFEVVVEATATPYTLHVLQQSPVFKTLADKIFVMRQLTGVDK